MASTEAKLLNVPRVLFLHMADNGAWKEEDKYVVQFTYAIFKMSFLTQWKFTKGTFTIKDVMDQALLWKTFDIKGTAILDPQQPTLRPSGSNQVVDLSYLNQYGMTIRQFFYYFLLTLKNYIFIPDNETKKPAHFIVCGSNVSQIHHDLVELYNKIGYTGISHHFKKELQRGKTSAEIKSDQEMLNEMGNHLLNAPTLFMSRSYQVIYEEIAPMDVNWKVIKSDGKHNLSLVTILFAYYSQHQITALKTQKKAAAPPGIPETLRRPKKKNRPFGRYPPGVPIPPYLNFTAVLKQK